MRLVRSCQVLQIRLGILWRDPPLKHHPAWAPYREQVAIPLVLCRMGGRQAMRVMILDKRLEVSQPGHCVMRSYLAWRSQCGESDTVPSVQLRASRSSVICSSGI